MKKSAGSVFCAVWCSLMAACGAVAPSKPESTTQAGTKDKEQMICKDERPLGSYISKRRCMSNQEFERQQEATRREMSVAREKTNKRIGNGL